MTKKIVPFEISLKSTKRAGFTFQPRPQILTNDANAAELNFIITDTSTEELAGSTATVLLFMKDGSFFQNTDVTRANNTFIYTIKPNQAKHKGVAQVQLVVKIGSVENASPLMEVDIVGGLESKPIVEREIQDWTSLTAEAKAFVEQIKDFTLEGFVENKMGEELANLETNYATRLTGLERKDTELTAQLAQTGKEIDKVRSAIDYGQLFMPVDFPDLPFNFYRDFDSQIKHDFNFDDYKNGTEIYVNWETGSDNTGNGSISAPYQRLSKALEVVAAGLESSYTIRLQSNHFAGGATVPNPSVTLNDKKVAIIADNSTGRTLLSTHSRNLIWTADGNGVYKATRSATYAVLDKRKKDFNGVPSEVKHVTTLAECQSTPNTWYTDNISVWVHAFDKSIPNDDDFIIGIQLALFDAVLNNSTLYLENIDIIGGRSTYLSSISGDINSELVVNNGKFIGGNLRSNMVGGNALSVNDIGQVLMFESVASLGARDGFNYHFANIPENKRRECLVVEYNCVSYDHGLYDTNKNNNATTCHDGASILRIGSIGYNTTGPVLADVNGCYSIQIDCHMKDALDGLSRTKSAYFFDNNSAITPGKAYLINSDGGGDNDSLNAEVGFDIYIKGFRGINIPDDLDFTFIN